MATTRLPRPAVLVIDDDDAVRAALCLALEDEFEVISAGSGQVGLEELARRRVAIVILDLLMPDIDGWEVFERARRMSGQRPRIVFLTGVDSSAAAVAALKLGAEDWIVKPFEDSALLCQLRALLPAARPICVRGGDLGARATVATIASIRCGMPVRYEMSPAHAASEEGVVDLAAMVTKGGLTAVLGGPPIHLEPLHRTTARAIDFVSAHYRLASVAGLAENAGVTPNYLLERLRADLGVTPREYIARVRIEVIKQRLGQPNCPSLDGLAEEVGLCDAGHVHKTFARHAQGLPSAYRLRSPDDGRGNVQGERGSVH